MLSPQLLELLRAWWREGRRRGLPAAGRLAVSRPQSGRAAVDPPAQPRRPRRRRGRRDQEAGVAAHAAAQLRHPPARTGHRHPRHPGAARPRQARHHGALHPRRQHHDPHRDQPARPARAADRREAETRSVAGGRAPPEAGGRRHLPSPWGRLAPGQCRACEPGSAPGDVGDRAMPLGRRSAAMSSAARTAATAGSPTTLVATAIAPSVRARRHRTGSPPARPICCRSAISTSSSPCRPRSPRSPTRTRRWSTTCCSAPRPRRCSPSPPIPSTSALASAPPPCSTAGARR